MIKAAATLKSLQFKLNLTDCYGRLSFGPVNPGQGLTIGNALRRILLNDLPGIGVIGAEIDGVQSEFSTLPGVRESVIEIFLNLRELVFAPLENLSKNFKKVLNLLVTQS
jgi:DNA-directed RNA polymerase subunit alpha